MTFPQHMVGLLKPKGLAFGTDYQDVYDAYITKPDLADAEVDNIMINGWIADGVWAKLDTFTVLANHITGADSLRDWITPANTATAYNSPAFAQWEGYTGNGSNAYIDLNWNPNTDGVNYTQNSASFGAYARINVDENKYIIGANVVVDSIVFTRYSGNCGVRVNTNVSHSGANTDSRGMFIANRVLSSYHELWKNKVRIVNSAQGSTGIPNANFHVLAINTSTGAKLFVTNQASLAFTGSGLTQTDINNITDRFETRMDYHGTGVIAA